MGRSADPRHRDERQSVHLSVERGLEAGAVGTRAHEAEFKEERVKSAL